MNFLFIRAKKSIYDLPWALLEMGHTISVIEEYEYDPLKNDPEPYYALEARLMRERYDYLISYIFIPIASDICERLHIEYISWTYDSPLISLFSKSVHNSCNYIFIFDRMEYEHLKEYNISRLYYLPMGANLSRTGLLEITDQDERKFSCDISFIGNLYEQNAYNEIISLLPEPLALELKTYLMKNLCNWKETKPWPSTSNALTLFLDQTIADNPCCNYDIDHSLYYGMLFLTRKLAEMDRITVLNTLAQNHKVNFYTTSASDHLIGIDQHNGVDYYTDMNKIFYLSKINLNITLPSIETGLPQRIFDIMACGGFLMTNYQDEISDYFTIGKDIEVYHDLSELLEKTDYYLAHEKERLTIAMNGYQRVRDHHSYTRRLTKMLNIVRGAEH